MLAFVSFFLLSLLSFSNASDECDANALIKASEEHSACARREKPGILVGHGYNVDLPHADGDFALLGIDPANVREGVIVQGTSDCDCERSFCLTPEQSERLFQMNIDRAEKYVTNILRSSAAPLPCCSIRNSLTALVYTFGAQFVNRVPDALSYITNGQWRKISTALLTQNWCSLSEKCSLLAERIGKGCGTISDNAGCSQPTPKACDASGTYCCAANNTCCQYPATESRRNQAYWCCPLIGAACCSASTACCPKAYPVCCGKANSCCFVNFPVCCFPGTAKAYCCATKYPVCLGDRHCGSLDANTKPILGKVSRAQLRGGRDKMIHF